MEVKKSLCFPWSLPRGDGKAEQKMYLLQRFREYQVHQQGTKEQQCRVELLYSLYVPIQIGHD